MLILFICSFVHSLEYKSDVFPLKLKRLFVIKAKEDIFNCYFDNIIYDAILAEL